MNKENNLQKNNPVEKILRKKKGLVVSNKGDKTIVVKVMDYKTHPKYVKKYRQDKRYQVHDPENKFKAGDQVEFIECRPISRCKKWIVLENKSKEENKLNN